MIVPRYCWCSSVESSLSGDNFLQICACPECTVQTDRTVQHSILPPPHHQQTFPCWDSAWSFAIWTSAVKKEIGHAFQSSWFLCIFLSLFLFLKKILAALCLQINLDSKTRLLTSNHMSRPNRQTFEVAQKRIEALMEKDSYPRFLQSDVYQELLGDQRHKLNLKTWGCCLVTMMI